MPVGTSLGDQFESIFHMMTSKFQPETGDDNVISPKQDQMKDPNIEVNPDTLEDRKNFLPQTIQVSDKAFLNAPKSPDVEDRRQTDVPDLTLQRLIDPMPFAQSVYSTQHLEPGTHEVSAVEAGLQTKPGTMEAGLGGIDLDKERLKTNKLVESGKIVPVLKAEDNDKVVAQDKTGRVKFTEADIDKAINIGMAFSGGGLGVTNSRSVGGLFKFLRPDSEKLATPVDALLLKKHMQAYGHKAEVERLPTLGENRVWVQHPNDPDSFAYVRPKNAADPRAPLDWEPK